MKELSQENVFYAKFTRALIFKDLENKSAEIAFDKETKCFVNNLYSEQIITFYEYLTCYLFESILIYE